jgi:integrase
MARKALTDLGVGALTSKGTDRADYFDALCTGLSVRVTKDGKKTWALTYTSPRDGKRARITIGTYPATSLADARIHANAKRGLVEQGRDPRDIANDMPSVPLITNLIDDYIRLHVRPDGDNFLRTCMEVERRFDKDVIPVVGNVPVKDFRMMHLNRVINPIMERGADAQANHVFSDMRHMMKFAVRRGEYGLEFNPIADAELPGALKKKERWLTLEEIRTVWRAVTGVFIKSDYVPTILRLIIATGQRPGEVCGISRAEVDTFKRVWTIPALRSKNGFEHQVPLNDLAYGIIVDGFRETNGEYLFQNEDGQPFNVMALGRAVIRAWKTPGRAGQRSSALTPGGKFSMAKWTAHDLRRSVATQMSMTLGTDDMHIGHVLNHRSVTKKSVTQNVYNQNPYLNEKRAALEKWGALLERLIAGEQVVELDTQRVAA